jgi:chlorite dismutase
MEQLTDKQKRSWNRVRETIKEDVSDYWDSFKQPLMVSKLGKRQQRNLKDLDITLVTACRKMQQEGMIKIFITENMCRYLIPTEVYESMTEQEFMVFKAKYEKDALKMETGQVEVVHDLPTGGYFNDEAKEKSYDF